MTANKPNIVLILADNLGWGELGCYGGGALRGAPTPRIDALAQQGLRLTNFNVESGLFFSVLAVPAKDLCQHLNLGKGA